MGRSRKHAAARNKRRVRQARWGPDLVAIVSQVRKPVLLLAALILASLATMALVVLPATGRPEGSLVRTMSLEGEGNFEIQGVSIAERAMEQKYQVHLQESTAQAGDIPYVDVWVLNDPFFPLIGDPGTLSDNEGTLDSKLGHMLGRATPPSPLVVQLDAGGNPTSTGGTPGTTGGAALGINSTVAGNVVLVEQITETRGIMYARIKVGSEVYDNVKAGAVFADNYKISEFKDYQTVVILCGDESYELKVGQLRRI